MFQVNFLDIFGMRQICSIESTGHFSFSIDDVIMMTYFIKTSFCTCISKCMGQFLQILSILISKVQPHKILLSFAKLFQFCSSYFMLKLEILLVSAVLAPALYCRFWPKCLKQLLGDSKVSEMMSVGTPEAF